MSNVDKSKRNMIALTGGVGIIGAGFTAVPFVSSFSPSEKAKAAGAAVEVDISALKVGEKMTVEWRGKPVWIIKRSPEQLATLSKVTGLLADPESKRKPDELTPMSVWAFAHIWAARHQTSLPWVHSPRCRTTGQVDFCALATAQRLIWLAGCTKTNPHQTTWKYRHICM
jgi:Ubiquitinol-cytochrome C reductase Fe-S subunit TAT signal